VTLVQDTVDHKRMAQAHAGCVRCAGAPRLTVAVSIRDIVAVHRTLLMCAFHVVEMRRAVAVAINVFRRAGVAGCCQDSHGNGPGHDGPRCASSTVGQ